MAEKIKLKDYQKSILDKLEAIKTDASSEMVKYLGVEIGNRNVLVDLLDVSETLAMADIQPIPLVKPWFLGMSNVRGTLYAINDLRRLLDDRPTNISSNTRMLLINDRITSNVGFVVNRLIGLRSKETFKRLEPSTEETVCFTADRYEDEEKKLWMVFDCKKLVKSRAFETPYAL
jgi:twitching motility protein PilI